MGTTKAKALESRDEVKSGGAYTIAEIKSAFASFASGLALAEPKGGFVADGKIHRCDVIGHPANNKNAGSYQLFADGIPAGWAQNWTNGAGVQTWCSKSETSLTPAERAEQCKRMERARKVREIEEAARHKKTAKEACRIWNAAKAAPDNHPYLAQKGVTPHGLRVHNDGRLLVPLRDTENALHSLQFIDDAGSKRFLPGGRKHGLFFVIGDINPEGALLIGEGFATMASCHEATGLPAVVAFDCGNLLPVAQTLRQKSPAAAFLFCADHDAWTRKNPGESRAREAAAAVGGRVAVPKFTGLRANSETDFNDLAIAEGPDAVRRCIEAAPPERVTPRLHKAGPYEATEHGLHWTKHTRDGSERQRLANFCAWITGERIEDDGAERRSLLDIEAEIHDRTARFMIAAASFSNMGWVVENIGADAVLEPGFGAKDRTRAAIQYLSGRVLRHHTYAHTGWRHFEAHGWAYLHTAGAIGARGALSGIDVNMPGPLSRYALPAPGTRDEIAEAVRASLAIVDIAPDRITVPLLASTYRAALGSADFSLHYSGFTGSGKSELAALAQQHFGPEMHAKQLPGAWSSTANQLEGLAFSAKDTVFVIDDFVPQGTAIDRARLNQSADRVLRGVGNASGRGRAGPDGKPRAAKPPRALVISTGEEIPGGQSLRARMLVIEVTKGSIGDGVLCNLTSYQENAISGIYAMAMAGFIQWLATDFEGRRREFETKAKTRRQDLVLSSSHARTGDIGAQLATAWRFLMRYAVESGAISQNDAMAYLQRADTALAQAAHEQSDIQETCDPVERFRALLNGAVSSGRAHIESPAGGVPVSSPEALGWRRIGTNWQPLGRSIGWEDSVGGLYLEPEAAFAAVQEMGAASGEGIGVGNATLRKRLHERRLLLSTEKDKNKERLTVRQTIGGRRRNVLHIINLLAISENGAPSAPSRPAAEIATKNQRDAGENAPQTSAPVANAGAPSAPTMTPDPIQPVQAGAQKCAPEKRCATVSQRQAIANIEKTQTAPHVAHLAHEFTNSSRSFGSNGNGDDLVEVAI